MVFSCVKDYKTSSENYYISSYRKVGENKVKKKYPAKIVLAELFNDFNLYGFSPGFALKHSEHLVHEFLHFMGVDNMSGEKHSHISQWNYMKDVVYSCAFMVTESPLIADSSIYKGDRGFFDYFFGHRLDGYLSGAVAWVSFKDQLLSQCQTCKGARPLAGIRPLKLRPSDKVEYPRPPFFEVLPETSSSGFDCQGHAEDKLQATIKGLKHKL